MVLLQQEFLVYKISCKLCGKVYIGESARRIQTRIGEHVKTKSSNVKIHFIEEHREEDPYQLISWEILHENIRNWYKRLTLEAIYISEIPSSDLMNGCQGRRLNYRL